MKTKTRRLIPFLAVVISTCVFFYGCSDDNTNTARVEIRLTDAPGDYEEVNIDIQAVKIHTDEGEPDSGWKSLEINPGVYDLLTLTNGLDTLLGTIEIPAGTISQIRLILGDNNTIKIDDDIFSLSTPSAQTAGLKLNVHTEVYAGITYKFLLDFDAARSIVHTGSDSYKLKPVIRIITEATSGAITGMVSIPASTPAVYAILESDTLGTTFADSNGHFLISGLQTGSYTVSFAPATGYTIPSKTGITVINGNVTNLGTVTVE